MSSTAWKDWERRFCRALGAQRQGPESGSDDDGSAPFAVECKRTTRYQLRAAWVAQARRQGKATGRPWVLGLSQHYDPRPLAVTEAAVLVQLVNAAGRRVVTPDEYVELLRASERLGLEPGPAPRLLEP